MQAEEALLNLQISNDPKPVYNIDVKEADSQGYIGQLYNILKGRVTGEEVKPYWMETELDKDGLQKLKQMMVQARSK